MSLNQDFLKSQGERYQDFIVIKYLPLPELNCILRELVHACRGLVDG